MTEREIPKTVAENVKWLHPYLKVSALAPLTENDIARIKAAITPLVLQAESSLADITAACDDKLGLTPGLSLSVARHLRR